MNAAKTPGITCPVSQETYHEIVASYAAKYGVRLEKDRLDPEGSGANCYMKTV